jgi:flagellar biosynthesis chaperone FliJ
MAAPLRSKPEDLSEELMKPEWEKKMSRRDKARQDFVRNFRRRQKINSKYRNIVTVELEKLRDIEEQVGAGVMRKKKMSYRELVDELNKDVKHLEHSEKPLMIVKDEATEMAEIHKK